MPVGQLPSVAIIASGVAKACNAMLFFDFDRVVFAKRRLVAARKFRSPYRPPVGSFPGMSNGRGFTRARR
jgi:hypothetical protein